MSSIGRALEVTGRARVLDYTGTMQGTIIDFRKEQGLGHASIDGVGDLSFDASVVGVPWTSLTPGTRVQVELGPSRLGGQRILKLWIPGDELPPDPKLELLHK